MKLFLIILLLFVFCPVLVSAQKSGGAKSETKSYTKVGDKMPSFNITDLEGNEIKVGDIKNKIIYVNFWATWCPPCLGELPRVEKEIWNKYKSDKFVMVAIAREQSSDEIETFKKENKLTFPMAADPNREVYKLFGNGGIPRSYIVSSDGKIVYQSVGYSSKEFDKMVKVIEEQIKKIPTAKAVK